MAIVAGKTEGVNQMKSIVILVVAFLSLVAVVGGACAGTYTFQPSPTDLYDLDHYYYYTWGINWTLPAGERIVSAKIEYTQIYNWDRNANILYTHLLNSAPVGVKTTYDNQGGGNAFAGQGVLLGTWSDKDSATTKDNLVYNIPSANLSWLADGNFGFGIDPDCHFYNCGVKCTVTTTTVPEPGSLVAFGTALISLAGFARRRLIY